MLLLMVYKHRIILEFNVVGWHIDAYVYSLMHMLNPERFAPSRFWGK